MLLRKSSYAWSAGFLLSANIAWALPFTIYPTPGTTLPSGVPAGDSVTAYYTVSNNTISTRANNQVAYLPPNVAQATDNGYCGQTFTLAPKGEANSSCILKLNITGTVDANDNDPHHHLFICTPGNRSCAGTNYPLNIILLPPALKNITVTPPNSAIHAGVTLQYSAQGQYSDGSTNDLSSIATWRSSNPAAATINNTGLATGTQVGTIAGVTTISAQYQNIVDNTPLTVNVINSISITPTSGTLTPFSSLQFNAVGTYTDNSSIALADVNWNSSNTAVATISPTGIATGVSNGSTNITANYNTLTSNIAALVVHTLTGITITPTSNALSIAQNLQYSATGTYSDNTAQIITSDVTWNSLNSNIATINSAGIATGITLGQSTISASQGATTSNSASLTVTTAHAYVLDNNNLVICTINTDGTLTQCNSPVTFTNGLTNIATNDSALATGTYLYAVDTANNLYSCSILNTGKTNNCRMISYQGNTTITGLAINTIGNNQYLYVLGQDGTIANCPITANTGMPSACVVSSGLGLTQPTNLTVVPNGSRIYITEMNAVASCPVDSSGAIMTPCAISTSPGSNLPVSICVDATNNYAYTANYNTNTVLSCQVNSGTLSACTSQTGLFNGPSSIAANPSFTQQYVANILSGTLTLCQVNASTGVYSTCTPTGTFIRPSQIVLTH